MVPGDVGGVGAVNGPGDYVAYFRTCRAIEQLARRAGLAPARARAVAERLAAAPLPAAASARITGRVRALLSHVGTAGRDDPRVVAAHRWLAEREPDQCPRLEQVRVLAMPATLHGWALGDTILVNARSPLYSFGDVGLAAVLAHEAYHQRHPDATEDEVVTATVRFAEAHGDEQLIALVRDAP